MASRLVRVNPVTVNDVLDGHVSLDLECLDRVYLNGYLAQLQVGGQVVQFLRHRGFPVPSPACLQQIGDAFRRSVASYADANHIPVVRLKSTDRNIDVMRRYLDSAARKGRSQVAAIGVAQEPQRVFIARQRDTDPAKPPQFSFDKKDRRVTVYLLLPLRRRLRSGVHQGLHLLPVADQGLGQRTRMGQTPSHPSGSGVHRVVQRVRRLRGSRNACKAICDRLGPGTINVFFQRWLARLPLPLTAADAHADYWWELSMAQVEVSRTLVFDAPRHARGFFEALLADNLDLGRPDTIEIVFDRQIRGGKRAPGGQFKTKLVTRGTEVTINAFYRHSRIKQYLKDGRALRIETVINAPNDLGCQRRLHNLDELQAKARAINARLLQAERVGQGCVLANPVFERIAHPTVTAEGRRATALRFGDSRVQALAGALCVTLCAVTGITNRSLRALMTGLLGVPYGMTQASYDLARLRRKGLITRRPHTNTYDLTADGLRFALFYTKVHGRILTPLFAADQPQAPPELRAALHTVDQHIDQRFATARLPIAA